MSVAVDPNVSETLEMMIFPVIFDNFKVGFVVRDESNPRSVQTPYSFDGHELYPNYLGWKEFVPKSVKQRRWICFHLQKFGNKIFRDWECFFGSHDARMDQYSLEYRFKVVEP